MSIPGKVLPTRLKDHHNRALYYSGSPGPIYIVVHITSWQGPWALQLYAMPILADAKLHHLGFMFTRATQRDFQGFL